MRLKKSLGQHLLIAHPTLEKIVSKLAPEKSDIVLEIGPGTGNLTKIMAKYAKKIIAVEKDQEMVEKLKLNMAAFDNIELIHADFLELDLEKIFETIGHKALFAGNIPYNISTPILFKLKKHKPLFERGIITVQKEVAERLIAKSGGKDYGILSILMQSELKIEKCFDISPKSFFPPPKVKSSVVIITVADPPPYHIENKELFANIVKTAFNRRRKMIRNSLKTYIKHFAACKINPTSRPEELSIGDFAGLTLHLSRSCNC
ncbi:MAG: ribosomal RNA small subunit methyltransferase A [Deltaproteobacteria bacterium]|nr:ribosomal RNA small subunit methyltransferase A [Deltaproteobacteria bacterium]